MTWSGSLPEVLTLLSLVAINPLKADITFFNLLINVIKASLDFKDFKKFHQLH